MSLRARPAGDLLLAVTDGVTEGAAPDKTLGEDRVGVWLAEAGDGSSLEALAAEVRAHEAGGASDDVAAVLVTIRVGGRAQ